MKHTGVIMYKFTSAAQNVKITLPKFKNKFRLGDAAPLTKNKTVRHVKFYYHNCARPIFFARPFILHP